MSRHFLAPILLIVAVASIAVAGDDKNNQLQKTTGVPWAKQAKQGYTIQAWISNQLTTGQAAFNPNLPPLDPNGCNRGAGGIGLIYPVGGAVCIEHLFGAGPMIGGLLVQSDGTTVRRVTEGYNGTDSRSEFIPLPRDTLRDRIWITSKGDIDNDSNFTPPRPLAHPVNRRYCDDDGDGLVDEDPLDGLDNDGDWNVLTDDVGSDGIPDSLETGCKGGYDPVTNPDPAFDDYNPNQVDVCHPDPTTGRYIRQTDKNKYTEKNGIPDHGEPHVDEDYGAVSDHDLISSVTDTVVNTGYVRDHIPMGIKAIQTSYAWRGDFADGILPLDYEFINVGKNTFKDVYLGFFADMDVGPLSSNNFNGNDYACYMPDLRTAYIHNAVDRGTTPLGLTVLGTSVPLTDLNYIFHWQVFNAMGVIDSVLYDWMTGAEFGGQLVEPCQSPSTPQDISILFSFGPFNGKDGTGFKPGDTIKISVAFVAGEAVESGPHNLRENAQKALRLYQSSYLEPLHLPSPKLVAESGFKKITLHWYPSQSQLGGPGPFTIWDDSNKIAGSYPDTSFRRRDPPCGTGTGEQCASTHLCTYVDGKPYLPGGRIIGGFRLYRSEDPGTVTPEAKSFTLLRQYDLPDNKFGYNTGVESTFVDTNLTRGKRYWYAVTSYGLPDISVLKYVGAGGSIIYDTLYTENTESSINENALGVTLPFSVSSKLGEVLVVPNPYRTDQDYTYESGGWEGRSVNWTENNRLIKFIHLPARCTIRIFTLTGDEVATLEHDDPVTGELNWNLLSESNRALASGVYVFTVESDLGKQIGKFALIR